MNMFEGCPTWRERDHHNHQLSESYQLRCMNHLCKSPSWTPFFSHLPNHQQHKLAEEKKYKNGLQKFFFLKVHQAKSNMALDIPRSSKCVKCVPFHPKNLPKGRNFTYMEDPGIMDGWKTSVSFWDGATWQVLYCWWKEKNLHHLTWCRLTL